MTKRNYLLLVMGVTIFVGMVYGGSQLAYRLIRDEPAAQESTINNNVNQFAAVSGAGNPLPSEAREDVSIQLVDTSPNAIIQQATLLYDYETGNYELLAYDSLGALNMTRYNGQYYAYDDELDTWEELTEQEATDLFDVSTVYFDQGLVDQFIRSSVFLASAECETALCSAWQVIYGENDELDTLTIRVNNQTRKIFDINAVGNETDYTLKYTYREVDIQPPPQP